MPEDCIFSSGEKQDILNQIVSGVENQDSIRDFMISAISDNNQSIFSELETYINARYTQTINALNNISNAIQENQWTCSYASLAFQLKSLYSQTLFFLNFLMLFLKQIDNLFKFDRSNSDTIYVELEFFCSGFESSFVLSEPSVGSFPDKQICGLISSDFTTNQELDNGAESFSIKIYFCLAGNSIAKNDIFSLLLKNFFKSGLNTSFLAGISDRVLSKTWTDGIIVNSAPTNEEWRLLDSSVSSIPSVIDCAIDTVDTAIDTVDAVNNKLESWRDQVDDTVNDISQVSEMAKLDAILVGMYNPKIANKLIGQALNFGCPEKKNFSKWIESSFDWEVPAWLQWVEDFYFDSVGSVFPEDHYDFSKLFEMWSLPEDKEQQLWLSDEMKLLLNVNLSRNSR